MLGSKGTLTQADGGGGFGELVEDPNGLLNLPLSFQYKGISYQEGGPLSDGKPVPGDVDAWSHSGVRTEQRRSFTTTA